MRKTETFSERSPSKERYTSAFQNEVSSLACIRGFTVSALVHALAYLYYVLVLVQPFANCVIIEL